MEHTGNVKRANCALECQQEVNQKYRRHPTDQCQPEHIEQINEELQPWLHVELHPLVPSRPPSASPGCNQRMRFLFQETAEEKICPST